MINTQADLTERARDYVDIVFDGPPSHESGRFVEVENSKGASIKFGEWVHRDDGYWALRIVSPQSEREAAAAEARRAGVFAFAEAILHGDEAHRKWLRDAATAFVDGRPGASPPAPQEETPR